MSAQWAVGKAEMRRSPDARGARGGNSARGACAFPYRNKQCEPLQRSNVPIEVAGRSPTDSQRNNTHGIHSAMHLACHSDQALARGGIP